MRYLQKLVIKHTIEKSKEGTYYTIPFEVPENVDSFTVSYSYNKVSQGITGKKRKPCIVDLGIIDSDGQFIGWSGSAKDKITVGEFSATNGYLCKKIKSGTWKTIVGAYKISRNCIDVEYTIEYCERQVRLYYGDLHIHSDASDGQYSGYKLGIMARKKGLDFIALANHNNYSENLTLPSISGVTFIPAVEWTHYKGHMNFYGVLNPFENSFIANSEEEMVKLINDAVQKGAVISVNHPECPICPYLWKNDDVYEMMEIWNGPMRPANVRAIEKWTGLLKRGKKISAVGGSDFHRTLSPVRMGNPITAVYSISQSADDLLHSIKKGHSFIASGKKAPKLYIGCGNRMMGDTIITNKRKAKLEIRAENMNGCSLYLVTAIGEKNITGQNSVEIAADTAVFAYLKAVGKYDRIVSITNPIYISTVDKEQGGQNDRHWKMDRSHKYNSF